MAPDRWRSGCEGFWQTEHSILREIVVNVLIVPQLVEAVVEIFDAPIEGENSWCRFHPAKFVKQDVVDRRLDVVVKILNVCIYVGRHPRTV